MSVRLYKLRSIFTRTDGMIRKGLVENENIPLWYSIYYHFPPDSDPDFERPVPNIEIKEIFYAEDAARAEIHKLFSKKLRAVNLLDNSETMSQRLVKLYQELTVDKGLSKEKALQQIKEQEENNQPFKTDLLKPKASE